MTKRKVRSVFPRILAATCLATAIVAGYPTSSIAQSSEFAAPTAFEHRADTADQYGFDAGVGIVDITPTEPVVLAGSPTQLEVVIGEARACM